ncbi:hypothetical protein HK099_002399, partial [Clydaea vesicula]
MFIETFTKKCEEMQIDIPLSIIDTLNKSSNSKTLNLSSHTLNQKICLALGFALKDDTQFEKLVIGDSFLGDDGVLPFANNLKHNSKIYFLDLRGNNIRSDGAIAISSMLKLNNSVKILSLEWNCIGIWETGVKSIADSLKNNHSLEELDFRNNKIGPQAAQSLANALKHNTNLKRLDLRWNNVGLIGGRAFLDMLKWNTTLSELELTGNEIPEDIIKSISLSVERNRDKQKTEMENKIHTSHLNSTLKALQTSHNETLSNFSLKYHESENTRSNLSIQLEKAIREIKEVNEIRRDFELRLDQVTREKNNLFETLEAERLNNSVKFDKIQKDLLSVREERLKREDQLGKQLSSVNFKLLETESNLRSLEVENEVLKRDKKLLLGDIDKFKEKEIVLNESWEEKVLKLELNFNNKLDSLKKFKDHELDEKVKRFEEKLKNADD